MGSGPASGAGQVVEMKFLRLSVLFVAAIVGLDELWPEPYRKKHAQITWRERPRPEKDL